MQFVGEPVFAKRMYQTPEGVQRAAREVLTELAIPAGKSLPDGASGAYTLLFRHECRYEQSLVFCIDEAVRHGQLWTHLSL